MATTEKKAASIVHAMDLGWGWVKYSRRSPEGGIEFGAFPSLAPRHAGVDLAGSVMGRRDTVVVSVDGTLYEVGPDSGDLDSNDASRNLNDQYIYTDQYRAVFLGALSYMREPEIDVLVVGLPLSNMQAAPKLKEMLTGAHKVADGATVLVKEVAVIPQPLGGLLHCLGLKDRPELEFMREEMNLVIDPGFLTFDFLLSNGEKVIENRSGAHPGGVSKVLRSIADSISQKFGQKYENFAAIDRGLRRRKIKINGELEELDEHIKNTKFVLEGSVNYMKNIVGGGSDIDNIILLGGGASVYRRTLESYYPKHSIIVIDDGQLANVRGFYQAGLRLLASRR